MNAIGTKTKVAAAFSATLAAVAVYLTTAGTGNEQRILRVATPTTITTYTTGSDGVRRVDDVYTPASYAFVRIENPDPSATRWEVLSGGSAVNVSSTRWKSVFVSPDGSVTLPVRKTLPAGFVRQPNGSMRWLPTAPDQPSSYWLKIYALDAAGQRTLVLDRITLDSLPSWDQVQ